MQIISQYNNVNNRQNRTCVSKNSVNFTSRNAGFREIDEICRRVRNEFPTYLGSRMRGYSHISKEDNLFSFSEQMITCMRRYYISGMTSNAQLYRELDAVKRHKVANCAEYADAAFVALKINGYRDVNRVNLYAYNPKTKKMRDLDHTVVCVNLNLPKDYQYCPSTMIYSKKDLPPKYRVYPQRETIIVDAWNGNCEYANEMKEIYNNHKGLVKNSREGYKYQEGDKLLKNNEELCYLPIRDGVSFSLEDYAYLSNKYKGLVKPSNRKCIPMVDYSKNVDYRIPVLSDKRVKCIRFENNMKNSPSKEEYERLSQETLCEQFGVYRVEEPPKKKSYFQKTVALFKKIF